MSKNMNLKIRDFESDFSRIDILSYSKLDDNIEELEDNIA